MRTKLTIVLILGVLVLPATEHSFSQIYNEDFSRLQKDNLFRANKVWMVYGWTFRYIKGKQEKKGKKTSFERFDRKGNRSEEAFYNHDGVSIHSCQYLYDDEGFVVKKMGANSDVIYDKWAYEFSPDRSTLEKRSVYSKAKKEKWIYDLDAQKNILLESYFDMEGTLTNKIKFIYDKESKLIEKIEMDAYDNVYKRWSLEYDKNGDNVDLEHYKSGRLERSYHMTYDKKGNMKSKHEMDKEGNVLALTVYVYQFYDGLHAPRALGSKP